MKYVTIDARMITDREDGASNVLINIIRNIRYSKLYFFNIVYLSSRAKVNSNKNIRYIKYNVNVSTIKSLFFSHIYINKIKSDIYFYSLIDPPFFIKAKVSLLVHDLYFMYDKNYFAKTNKFKYKIIKLISIYNLKRAHRIFTISNTVKDQILNLIGKKNISVVYNGTSKKSNLDNNMDNNYILYVGNNRNHKNLQLLIECYKKSKVKSKLVLAGNIDNRYKNPNLYVSKDLDNIEILGRVTDAELDTLYRNCKYCIILSKYEGFGLPLIEAGSYKKAILCSDIKTFKEIYSGHAYFVNIKSKDDVIKGIEVMENDDKLRQDLEIKSYNKAISFSSERSANLLLDNLITI